jgi:hypothetical protein
MTIIRKSGSVEIVNSNMFSETAKVYSGIHSSIPFDANPAGGETLVYDQRREAVMLYLLQRKDKTVGAKELARECGYDTKGTQVALRKAIKEITHLLAARHLPQAVISNQKGFIYTEDPARVEESINRHRIRVAGIERTIRDETEILNRMRMQ